MASWFYTENGVQRGPIEFDELKTRATQGTLKPDDQVWKDGMADWLPARQIHELFTAKANPPPLRNSHSSPSASSPSPGGSSERPSNGSVFSKIVQGVSEAVKATEDHSELPTNRLLEQTPKAINAFFMAILVAVVCGLVIMPSVLITVPALIMIGLWSASLGWRIRSSLRGGYLSRTLSPPATFGLQLCYYGLSPLILIGIAVPCFQSRGEPEVIWRALWIGYAVFLIPASIYLRGKANRLIVASQANGSDGHLTADDPNSSPPAGPEVSVKATPRTFFEDAKDAGRIVSKQTERTKLQTLSLPSAFNALGKWIFNSSQSSAEIKDEFAIVKQHMQSVKQLKSQAEQRPKGEGVAAKVKEAAKATADAAQLKIALTRLNHAVTELGRAAFTKLGQTAGPAELIQPIVDIQTRLETLGQEIGELSQARTTGFLTPKQLLICAGGTVITLLIAFALMKMDSRPGYDSGSRVAALGQLMAKGDKEWDIGKRKEAVADYMQMISDAYFTSFVSEYQADGTRIFCRTIDYQAENAGPESARQLIHKALQDDRITLMLENPDAKQVLEDELQKREARKTERRSRPSTRSSSSSSGNAGANWSERKAEIERQLKTLPTIDAVNSTFGSPTITHASRSHPNIQLWVWSADSENDDIFIVATLAATKDFSGYMFINKPSVHTEAQVDRMVAAFDGAAP